LKAIELLEKANETKQLIHYEEPKEGGFWGRFVNYLNPFKCGK
jgi:hypothetical protein